MNNDYFKLSDGSFIRLSCICHISAPKPNGTADLSFTSGQTITLEVPDVTTVKNYVEQKRNLRQLVLVGGLLHQELLGI